MTKQSCFIPDGQLIIFNFPAGAGGKMLQNCVGLSRHCVLNHLDYARWQLNYTGDFDTAFYQQKLEWILNTVPPREDMHNWLRYELDETPLYGINFSGFHRLVPVPNTEIYELGPRGIWSTVTVHNFGSTDYYPNYWPTIQHVSLVNNEQFGRRALAAKNTGLTWDEEWATLGRTPPGVGFEFDIDSTIYDQDKFLDQVEKLYNYLGFDDFQRELLAIYYNKYIQLHL